jgi:hypothetical protein
VRCEICSTLTGQCAVLCSFVIFSLCCSLFLSSHPFSFLVFSPSQPVLLVKPIKAEPNSALLAPLVSSVLEAKSLLAFVVVPVLTPPTRALLLALVRFIFLCSYLLLALLLLTSFLLFFPFPFQNALSANSNLNRAKPRATSAPKARFPE